MIPAILQLSGINSQTFDLFSDYLQVTKKGNILFPFSLNAEQKGFEEYGISRHFIPKQSFWCRPPDGYTVRHIFLFQSAMEAMAFVQTYASRIDLSVSLLISVGLLPEENTIKTIYSHNSQKAKYHLVFPNTIIGKVQDCLTACRIKNKHCSFSVHDNLVTAIYSGKDPIQFPANQFSLSLFQLKSGLRSRADTIKPYQHANFLDFLKLNYERNYPMSHL